MKKLFSISLLFIAVLVGCKDDDVKLTAEQYLTAPANGWIFDKIMYKDPESGVEIDLLTVAEFFPECDKDDSFIFITEGSKFTIAENTKCDPDDDAEQDAGTWSFNSDKTELTLNSTADGILFTITKFAINDANISGEIAEALGPDSGTAKVTFKKK